MNLALFQADVFTGLIKEISPGMAVIVGLVYLLTRVAMDLHWIRKEVTEVKLSAVTREGMKDTMRIALLELREELDHRYEERFQRNGHTNHQRAAGA